MKKILFVLSLMVLTVTFSVAAQAQSSRLYFAGYIGLNTYNENDFNESVTPVSGNMEYDNAISLAGSLGLRLTRNFRIEGEVSRRRSDLSNMNIPAGEFKLNGDITTWVTMLNGYYDFDLGWRNLNPFLSAGLGVAWNDVVIDDISNVATDASGDDFGLAWQVGGGMKLRMSDDMAFTGGYRYLATSAIEFDNYELDFGSHEIRIGVEYDIPVAR